MIGRFNITNDDELRTAYGLSHIMHLEKSQKYADLRREMRLYNRSKQTKHIVKINYDGNYIEFVSLGLPVGVYDEDFAKEFFEHEHFIEMFPSAYDCTGQAFTAWSKVFARRGMWYAYHCVCCDV